MLFGYGWCVLQSSREPYRLSSLESADEVDCLVDAADRVLWAEFHKWMAVNADGFMEWHLREELNNAKGILLFAVSRNHRTSSVWDMLAWIAKNGPGSYGLLYVHDDEDFKGSMRPGRGLDDHSNVFRVHRLANGTLSEFDDPFLSPIVPTILPNDLA